MDYGYNTAAFIANPLITKSTGLLDGYDYFYRKPRPPVSRPSLRLASFPSPENLLIWVKFLSLSDKVVQAFRGFDGKKNDLLVQIFPFSHELEPKDRTRIREEFRFPRAEVDIDKEFDFPRANEMANAVLNYVDYALAGPDFDAVQTKFFLFLHDMGPHGPYKLPMPYDVLFDPGRQDRPEAEGAVRFLDESPPASVRERLAHDLPLYDGAIRFFDDNFQVLFSELKERGLLDNTLVILLADHGEEFYEHGEIGHGEKVFEEIVRIPLVLWYPGKLPQGVEVKEFGVAGGYNTHDRGCSGSASTRRVAGKEPFARDIGEGVREGCVRRKLASFTGFIVGEHVAVFDSWPI